MAILLDGSAGVTTNSGAVYNGLQTATAVASTSGTSIDFTGIPSWVKRITVMFDGVSLSGTSDILVQVGDSGGIEITGYSSISANLGTAAITQSTSTVGFVMRLGLATASQTGQMLINNLAGNVWIESYSSLGNSANTGGGSKTLSATLDRIRITTTNGTDLFDAGSVNIMYE